MCRRAVNYKTPETFGSVAQRLQRGCLSVDTRRGTSKLHQRVPAPASRPKMATVLVVDGDSGTRTRVSELLTAGGYDVRAVADRVAGIDCLGSDSPSAILLSLQSDRSGTQSLCVAIRQSAPGIPIIVLGPDIDVRTKVALFELGADDYMVRPVDSSEMLARLRAVIRRSRWAFESS